jgi:hypothetical protein
LCGEAEPVVCCEARSIRMIVRHYS